MICGYVECSADIIVRHIRSYDREDLGFDPLHTWRCLSARLSARPGGPHGRLGIA
jgi:hypothetical protein